VTAEEKRREELTCTRCGVIVECCAACEREGCRATTCYRCMRLELKQQLAEPHLHGG
jgi:hypothetical protein